MAGFGSISPGRSDDDALLDRYYDPGTGLPAGGTDTYQPPQPKKRPTWMMEPDLYGTQTGALPAGVELDEAGQPRYSDTGEHLTVVRRPGLLPVAKTPEGYQFAKPKLADMASYMMGGPVPLATGEAAFGAGPLLRAKKPTALPSMAVPEPPVAAGASDAVAAPAAPATETPPTDLPSPAERVPVRGGTAGVDWSHFNQPFGSVTPSAADRVVIPTRNPRVQFTQGDLDKAVNLAMGFSGGGLATGAPKAAVGAREAFENFVRDLGAEPHGQAGQPAAEAAPVHPAAAGVEAPSGPLRADDTGGGGGREARVGQAQDAAAKAAGKYAALPGLPQKPIEVGDGLYIPGPIEKVKDVREAYMRDKLQPSYHTLPDKYHPLDAEHAKAIAQAYEDMPHTPDDPATRNSYDAMIKETRDQYDAIRQNHPELQLIPNKPGEDPYAATPRLAAKDVAENNRLHFFPTEQGFGVGEQGGIDMSKHPMMQPSGRTLNGKPLLNNDLFRIVHDYFGHLGEGYGFRGAGEDNAWRSHASMYSDLARPAMTTETRGQNSWVNYGPHGEANRNASAADTRYADQKVGLMPEWTMRDRGSAEPIGAWHGSPYGFSDFEAGKGVGSGMTEQGAGHYLSTHEPLGNWYRYNVAAKRDPILQRHGLDSQDGARIGIELYSHHGDVEATAQTYREHLAKLQANDDGSAATRNSIKRMESAIGYLTDPDRARGHLYHAVIDQPPETILNRDLPLSQQPQHHEAIRNIFGDVNPNVPAGQVYQKLANQKGAAEVSRRLKEGGISGMSYTWRANPRDVGSTNYVMFERPRILKRYAIPGMLGGGVALPAFMQRRGDNGS